VVSEIQTNGPDAPDRRGLDRREQLIEWRVLSILFKVGVAKTARTLATVRI
jgi:hypothetical protein